MCVCCLCVRREIKRVLYCVSVGVYVHVPIYMWGGGGLQGVRLQIYVFVCVHLIGGLAGWVGGFWV